MAISASQFNQSYKGGSGLNPDDWNYFRAARNRVNDTYDLGSAQNKYQQSTVRRAYNRSLGDLTRQYARQAVGVPSGFVKAGTLNSGLMQNAWGRFQQDRATSRGNLTGTLDDQLTGYKLALDQLGSQRTQGLAEISWQEAARRAAQAIIDARGGA